MLDFQITLHSTQQPVDVHVHVSRFFAQNTDSWQQQAHSLLAGVFHEKRITQIETGAAIRSEIKRMEWDVRFIAIHTIMWLWNNWGAERWGLSDWSAVVNSGRTICHS